MKKKILILAGLIILGAFIFLRGNLSSNNIVPSLQSGNILPPTPIPTPTSTPIVFDENSNLEEEVEKLTPEDFSGDFKTLKQEVAN